MALLVWQLCVSFVRTVIGMIIKPYETYRKLINHGTYWELLPLGAIIAIYFIIATCIKTASFRPYLLTRQFVLISIAVVVTQYVIIGGIWYAQKIVGGKGTIKTISLGWLFTLVPTVSWFLTTSLLYMIFPPPRTTRPLGIVFSILFLLFSSVLFFWKILLSYLTLRFALKLDLKRILVLSACLLPLICIYSVGMYRLGIFRIPFI